MLLVNHGKAKVLKNGVFLKKRMRSDHHLNFAGRDLFQKLLSFGFPDSPSNDAYAIVQTPEYALRVDEMLLGQDSGWRHQCSLIPIFDCNDNSLECNDRFPASDVALHQTHHRIRRLEVVHDFLQYTLLGTSWMKGQNHFHPLPDT